MLSCFALSLVLSLIKAFNGQRYGISIGGTNWSDLGYADDLAVIAKTKQELIEMIETLIEESSYFGLKVNFTKTKIMPIGPYAKLFTDSTIEIAGKKIEVVFKFEYLGRILNNKADDTTAVEQRIAKGWQVFQNKKSMTSIITHKHLSMKAKKQTIESYILPSLFFMPLGHLHC